MKTLLVLMVLFTGFFALSGVKILDNASTTVGNTAEIKCGYGLDCAKVSGRQAQINIKPKLGISTFASGDTTPAVDAGGPFFKSFLNNTVTITDFDGSNIFSGQEITLMSQGAVTIDVTSSGIICGTTDLVMVSGDMSKYVYDGTDWRCTSYVDQADNLN